jgi:hypothetical protein
MSFDDERPIEPCYVCNVEARSKLEREDIRQIFEDLAADRPPDMIPGLECWNCCGRGTTGGPVLTLGEYFDKLQRARKQDG